MSAVPATVCGICVLSVLVSGSAYASEPQDVCGFERIVVTAGEPMQLAELVTRADLVVEGATADSRTYLTSEGDIYTDYTFELRAVIKNLRRPDLRAGQKITLRRETGVVVVNSRTAESHENGFPRFTRGERYILFLKDDGSDHVYTMFGGAQGAFSADDDRVTPVARSFDANAEPPHAMPRLAFLGEVRALLKFGHE
ncbi:MAG TPA: hypothetical protein VE714_10625 [Gemmatimonadales bacterium]|nr:hypothetical protein [Gemmatimonadales bacterium]